MPSDQELYNHVGSPLSLSCLCLARETASRVLSVYWGSAANSALRKLSAGGVRRGVSHVVSVSVRHYFVAGLVVSAVSSPRCRGACGSDLADRLRHVIAF